MYERNETAAETLYTDIPAYITGSHSTQTTTSANSMAETPRTIKRTVLQSLPLPEFPGWESRLVMLDYPPGVAAPLHNHPVAATGYVVEGDVISQWEGGEVEKYSAGDSFVDLGQTMHLRSENASQSKGLKMLMSYVIKIGEPNVKVQTGV